MAPVNKLVSLTWLLWALRNFRRFTLHCLIDYTTLGKNGPSKPIWSRGFLFVIG